MQIFKSYMESIKGQAISQTNEILPLFALPYVSSPDKRETFQEIFSVRAQKHEHTLESLFCLKHLTLSL